MAEDPFDRRASHGSLWLRELQVGSGSGTGSLLGFFVIGPTRSAGGVVEAAWKDDPRGELDPHVQSRMEAEVEAGGSWSLTSVAVLASLG